MIENPIIEIQEQIFHYQMKLLEHNQRLFNKKIDSNTTFYMKSTIEQKIFLGNVSDWRKLGANPQKPLDSFSKGGTLSLSLMTHLALHYPETAIRIMNTINEEPQERQIDLIKLCVNITKMMVNDFFVKATEANDLLIKQLKKKRVVDQNDLFFYPLLLSHPKIFGEVFSTVMLMCFQNWMRRPTLDTKGIEKFTQEQKNLVLQAINISKPLNVKKFQQATLIDESFVEEEKVEEVQWTPNTAFERVVHEIITTEYAYRKDLDNIIQIFQIPLKLKNILTDEELYLLFANIEELIGPCESILEQWKSKHDLNDSEEDLAVLIGETFNSIVDSLIAYTEYCSAYTNAVIFENELRVKKDGYLETIDICESDPICNGLYIGSFLIKPVQRICKYPLFFRELQGHKEDKSSPGYRIIEEVAEKIGNIVLQVNEGKRIAESTQKTIEIERNLTGNSAGISLLQEGRFFLEEYMLDRNNKKFYLFLFTDLLLITVLKPQVFSKKKLYSFKDLLQIDDVAFIDNGNSFEIANRKGKKKKYKFSNPELKDKIGTKIKEQLAVYLEKNFNSMF